jgi:Spy/CpxP family protein refolding chaperone
MLKQSAGWAVTTLVAAFVAGGLVAWGLTTHYGGGWRRGHGGMGPGARGIQSFLGRELDLTAAQRDSVRAILERSRPKLEAIWRDVRPRVDSVRSTIDSEIAAQLTPTQRTRFEEIRRRMDERFHRERNREGSARK